ncbi:hypothetical protein JTS93_20945 [Clostridium botulinum]|nr:hypothetical protein [Clostridium botulinum]
MENSQQNNGFYVNINEFFKEPPTLSELALEIGTSHQNAKQIAIKLEEKDFSSEEGY